MNKKVKTAGKWVAAAAMMTAVVSSASVNVKATKITTEDIHPADSFTIAVIDSNDDDSTISKQVKKDKSLKKLDVKTNKLPEDVSALWVSEEDLTKANVKELYKQAKHAGKPFYVFGDDLNTTEINQSLGEDQLLGAEQGDGEAQGVIDMVGYKFEDGVTKPSFVISMNRGQNEYDLEGLKTMARKYNIKIKNKPVQNSAFNLFTPNVANAAGMNINLPSSFTSIKTWEAIVYNWIMVNSTTSKRASTYHVWEMFYDSTPSNASYKSFVYFRADEPYLESFNEFYSKDTVLPNGTANVLTQSYAPDNSAVSVSASITLSWPPSASVQWTTDGALDIFDSTGSLANDWHSFRVNDNEWTDTLLRPGDSWVSSQGYQVTQSSTSHRVGVLFSHMKEFTTQTATPSEYHNRPYNSSSGNTVYWTISK